MTNITDQNPPHIAISAQYIKDLSFENPGAPESLLDISNPQIDLDLKVKANSDIDGFFEVIIYIQAAVKKEEKMHYVVELTYAGLFQLVNIPEEQQELVLYVHCPAMIFPFARKIVADVVQDGGFQPLMIDPVDFGALYHKKLSENGVHN